MNGPTVEAIPAGLKVALVIRSASIYEQDGELIPGCLLSPNQARFLAEGLARFADEVEPTPHALEHPDMEPGLDGPAQTS